MEQVGWKSLIEIDDISIRKGLTVSSSCLWDKSTDGSCTVRWENKSICCIVNVFGLSM